MPFKDGADLIRVDVSHDMLRLPYMFLCKYSVQNLGSFKNLDFLILYHRSLTKI